MRFVFVIMIMTTQMQEPGASSWRKSPAQERSRRAEDTLARVARELLAKRTYTEIRVEEVARKAGISVGGFYGRFKGKSALLHLADIDFLDACLAAFDRAVPEEFSGTPEEIFRRFVSVMVRQFRVHKGAILQAMRHADEGDLSGFRARAAAFNEHVHGRLRRLLGQCEARIRHPEPPRAVNLAIFFASSAARDAVLRGSLATYPVTLSDEELVNEIVRAANRYLTGGPS